MPFEYTKDDVRRRIKIVGRDPISTSDLMAHIDRQVADGAWTYGVLYDARATSNPPSAAEMPQMAAYVQKIAAQHGARGPVAIVTRESATVAVAHIYSVLGKRAGFRAEVFWDIDEAERWLDARDAEAKGMA